MKNNRKAIPDKVRFEVFKRDSFHGRSATQLIERLTEIKEIDE